MEPYYCGLCESRHHALIDRYKCGECARVFCKQSIQEMIVVGLNTCPYCNHQINMDENNLQTQGEERKNTTGTELPPPEPIRSNEERMEVSQELEVIKELEQLIGETIPQVQEIGEWFFGVLNWEANILGLGLWGKGLTVLPESISKLTKLQTLDLSENQLQTIPQSIGSLKSLKELYLSENNLTSLPPTIGDLERLKKLYLDHNHLLSIPNSIGQLKQLEELALDHNQLKEIPDTIGKLTNMHTLFLDHNQLQDLPESLIDLKGLNFLDFSENNLDKKKISPQLLKLATKSTDI